MNSTDERLSYMAAERFYHLIDRVTLRGYEDLLILKKEIDHASVEGGVLRFAEGKVYVYTAFRPENTSIPGEHKTSPLFNPNPKLNRDTDRIYLVKTDPALGYDEEGRLYNRLVSLDRNGKLSDPTGSLALFTDFITSFTPGKVVSDYGGDPVEITRWKNMKVRDKENLIELILDECDLAFNPYISTAHHYRRRFVPEDYTI